MLKPCGFLANNLEVFTRWWQNAIVYCFGMTEDQTQWCAEFMGDIGSHLSARVDRARKFCAHLIESFAEFAQFVIGTYRNLLREISLRYSLRRSCKFANGASKCA